MRKVVLGCLILLYVQAFAHPWKAEHFIIVETDCGLDDFRALNLMLASPQIRVLGIVTSPGVLNAELGYQKVKGLLHDLHHEGIQVGVCRNSTVQAKNCKAAADFSWGKSTAANDQLPEAWNVVARIFNHTREPISWVSLAGLEFVQQMMDSIPDFSEKIEEVIWPVSNAGELDKDFNFQLLPDVHHNVLANSPVPVHCIQADASKYPEVIIGQISQQPDLYSQKITASLRVGGSFSKHMFDEFTALFLIAEASFSADTIAGSIFYSYPEIRMEEDFNTLLNSDAAARNQVLRYFPMDTSAYQIDLSQMAHATIAAYGKEEWMAGVMANEMHRHVGVYAITGVKMGIRAREFFGAGLDEMRITSYTGKVPPFSCMNDGLQISTGATLGHGLIQVKGDSLRLPKAEFTYLGKTISIQLKEEYRKALARKIMQYKQIYGLRNDIYWELVRKEAIRIWAEWDRYEVFDID